MKIKMRLRILMLVLMMALVVSEKQVYAAELSASKEVITEETATKKSTTEEVITEETATKKSTAEEPTTEEPTTEEVTTEEPTTEEPTTEEVTTEEPTTEEPTTEAPDPVYQVTIVFKSNGATGTMKELVVKSGKASKLRVNRFKKAGFQFNGWNTKANGKGKKYAGQADVSKLATKANNGKKIVLYAQWKLVKSNIKSVKLTTPASFTVNFTKNKNANGYEIQYATKKNFKDAKSVITKKKINSKEITDITTGKTYYVRVRSFYRAYGERRYSDWSAVKQIKVKKVPTIENTKSFATIEADVTLTGSGTGYHAKLVVCTPTSAVSFGIQHDEYAAAPYTGKTMALIENVASNDPGGQEYTRPGNVELKRGKKYHLMMTIDEKGYGAVYVDYKKIGTFKNSNLANQFLYLRVEGCGRVNGDSVKAVFENIKLKNFGSYQPSKKWGTYEFKLNETISSKVKKNGDIVISGHVSGLPSGGDWDSEYESVSGIIQFIAP